MFGGNPFIIIFFFFSRGWYYQNNTLAPTPCFLLYAHPPCFDVFD
jgi:hypothetical protein